MRELTFDNYNEAIAEIERLHRGGYQAGGSWTLGQTCEHLSFYLRGSLDGFDFMLPWIVRKLLGRPLLRRLLRQKRIKPGMRTAPASVPADDVDENAAVATAIELLKRLGAHAGELHPSPLFDKLSADEWRELHLAHCAHHLSFLTPKET